MSAPAGGAGSAAAAAPQVTIYTKSTLPEAHPDKDDADAKAERAWKRYLFYVVGYCDTFHDFAEARPTKTKADMEEKSLDLGVKRSVRTRFVLDNIINAMDPSINFREIYATIKGDSTFEKSMYATFTDLLDNHLTTALNQTYAQQIKGHLSQIHSLPEGYAFQNIEIKNGAEYFSSAIDAAQLPNSSIIELRTPGIGYSDTWQKNFIDFLHKLFPNCVNAGRLKIVEDTATFPRELFTTNPTNFARFQKLDIPQTRWDPAGLTKFEKEVLDTPNLNVSAPSFRSLQGFSTDLDQQFAKDTAYFMQGGGKNSLILPGQVPARINILNAGPSVNHLFMHLIVHSDLRSLFTGLPADAVARNSELLKGRAKALINSANDPLKSARNTTLKLVQPAAGEVSNPELLRKYTTSKRTGDYENTNAAKYHNAVLFCGDEPEFVYAMLNEQPAIYHTHDAGGHKFRINVSKNAGLSLEDQAAREKEQTVISYAHKAFELTRLFTNVKEFVLEFFNNITDVLSKPLIQFSSEGTEYTDLFKYIIHKHILSNTKIITELQKSYTKFGELSSIIITRLSRYSITQLELDDLAKLKSTLLSKVEEKAELAGLQQEIKTLDIRLAGVIKIIPRSLNITQTSAAPNKACAFTEVDENELFYTKDAGGGGGGGEEFPKGWIVDSALFPTLNSLNDIMPEIINSIIFINRYTGQESLARTIKIKVKSEKIKINDALKGFGVENGFFEARPEVKQAAYADAAAKLEELISKFRSQQGGVTEANHGRNTRRIRGRGTKNIRHTGHAGYPPHKKSRRQSKHIANATIDLDKLAPQEFYKYIKESIIKLGDAPFGLKSEDYANQILCRMIIIDSINEIIGAPVSSKRVPKHRLDPLATSDHTSHKIISTPKKPKMQKGGALTEGDHLVWYRIYIDMIVPVWDRLHRNAPFSPRNSILISIINGTFLQSVLPLLEQLSLMNTTGNAEIDSIIAASIKAFDNINSLIDYSFNDSYYLSLPERLTNATTGLTGNDINYIINTKEAGYFKLVNDKYEAQVSLFKNILDYINFLNLILKSKEIDKEWSEADSAAFDTKVNEIGAIDTEEEYIAYMKTNMIYMNKNIRWAFQMYYNLFYFDPYDEEEPIKVDESDIYRDAEEETAEDSELVAGAEVSEPPAAGGVGGAGAAVAAPAVTAETMGGGRRRLAGHERKKGKRRSSPRRLSLKNR
jgi:hypothetical protein